MAVSTVDSKRTARGRGEGRSRCMGRVRVRPRVGAVSGVGFRVSLGSGFRGQGSLLTRTIPSLRTPRFRAKLVLRVRLKSKAQDNRCMIGLIIGATQTGCEDNWVGLGQRLELAPDATCVGETALAPPKPEHRL